MKNITTLRSEKNGSVDVTFTRAVKHQKHLAQFVCSMRSAVDIFNTLRVFTKEPIREQEIKLEWVHAMASHSESINWKYVSIENVLYTPCTAHSASQCVSTWENVALTGLFSVYKFILLFMFNHISNQCQCYHMWLNISKWGGCRQKSFWIRLTNVMCNKVKICQILGNGLRWPLAHIMKEPYLSGVKTWPEKVVNMLCYLFASLTHLQNKTFNHLKYGFLNSWNSNRSI